MKNETDPSSEPPCDVCGGKCCKYVSVEIDQPTDENDWGNIRWYLLHENVRVFKDHNGDWFIEFVTPCTAQNADNRCEIYEDRPPICRGHGVADAQCEYYDTPYEFVLSTVDELEAYLQNEEL